MKRRHLITLLAGAAARGRLLQQGDAMRRIGVLMGAAATELAAHGRWV